MYFNLRIWSVMKITRLKKKKTLLLVLEYMIETSSRFEPSLLFSLHLSDFFS